MSPWKFVFSVTGINKRLRILGLKLLLTSIIGAFDGWPIPTANNHYLDVGSLQLLLGDICQSGDIFLFVIPKSVISRIGWNFRT
jgi:hypothetical protein